MLTAIYYFQIVIPDKKIPNPVFQNVLPGSAADLVYQDAIRVPALPGEGQASFARLEETVGIDPNLRAVLQYANNVNRWKKLRHFQERIINSNSFCFPKESEIKDLFDYQVVKMYNTGLLDKIHHDTMRQGKPDEGRKVVSDDEEEILFEFSNLGFPGTLLASGVAMAALIGMVEKLSQSLKSMKLEDYHSSDSPRMSYLEARYF